MSMWIETSNFILVNLDYIRYIDLNSSGKAHWLEAFEEDGDIYRKHHIASGTESEMIDVQDRIKEAMIGRGLLIFSAAPKEISINDAT